MAKITTFIITMSVVVVNAEPSLGIQHHVNNASSSTFFTAVSSDLINRFRPTTTPTSVPQMAKFSEVLGRWVCPVEYRRKFPHSGIDDSVNSSGNDIIDRDNDEVIEIS